MKKIISITILSMFATQAASITINQFEQVLTHEEQEFYLAGLADGIVMGNAVNAAFGNPVDMCIPANIALGGGVVMNNEKDKSQAISDAVKISRETIQNNDKSDQVVVAVYFGLRRLFPCR